ncbi:unnamed protein product, partial [Prorocentrum cordatum]
VDVSAAPRRISLPCALLSVQGRPGSQSPGPRGPDPPAEPAAGRPRPWRRARSAAGDAGPCRGRPGADGRRQVVGGAGPRARAPPVPPLLGRARDGQLAASASDVWGPGRGSRNSKVQ